MENDITGILMSVPVMHLYPGYLLIEFKQLTKSVLTAFNSVSYDDRSFNMPEPPEAKNVVAVHARVTLGLRDTDHLHFTFRRGSRLALRNG
jgi:hypothetical protein